MKEINFYCIEEDVNLFLFSLLSKLIDNGKKIIVYSESQEKMEKLDSLLWTQKKTSFLPHLIQGEKGDTLTPILISNVKENKNNANFLLISNFIDDENFFSNFEKIFYMYSPINSTLINEVENNWNKYKNLGYNLKLLKKDLTGKWTEYNKL